MDLRHLRYFIAVAEEGSLSLAAERRLHTAQPSLSRQIRDLEQEIGVDLLSRGPRGIELTAAGRVFLDHARLVLLQVEAAGEAARRAARPGRAAFVLGILTGQEMEWLTEILAILRDELPTIDVTFTSQSSPELASALMRGHVDAALVRREPKMPNLAFKLLRREPLIAVLPSGHRLARAAAIRPQDLVAEKFISVPKATSPVLRGVIDDYAARLGITLTPSHEVDNIAMAVSLVASTGGIVLLPQYARNLLPQSVVARKLAGDVPTINLFIGYNKANISALLKRFLSHTEELIRRVAERRTPGNPP